MQSISNRILGNNEQIAKQSLASLKERFKNKFNIDPDKNSQLFIELLAYRIKTLEDNLKDRAVKDLDDVNFFAMLGEIKKVASGEKEVIVSM